MSASTRPVYLDHNATSPLLPEVREAMLPYLGERFGNPSSNHVYGREARAAVDEARANVAALLGVATDEIVFTSGGTEANNLAIRGVAATTERRGVVTSTIEHPATVEPCKELERVGFAVARVPVDARCVLSIEEAGRVVDGRTALVTIIHANNETGVLQPIADVARIAKERGAIVHTDAAQSVGKLDVRPHALGVDLLSIAGHKLGAPKGVGALFVRRGTRLEPFVRGAGHERGLRPGTENVASIVGLGVACAVAARRLASSDDRLAALRDRLLGHLRRELPSLVVHGDGAPRLLSTLNLRFPGLSGSAVLHRAEDLAASTGSACHDGAEHPSGVLLAMGIAPAEALGAIRLSVGFSTTEDDVDRAASSLVRAARALGARR